MCYNVLIAKSIWKRILLLQVCRDVFATESELKSHENLHKYPGGYVCSACGASFRNDAACVRHQEIVHQVCSTLPRLSALQCIEFLSVTFNSCSNVCVAKVTTKSLRKMNSLFISRVNTRATAAMQCAHSAVRISSKRATFDCTRRAQMNESRGGCDRRRLH